MHDRDERPELIMFADTKGEKPETYEYIAIMQAWLKAKGWPPITTVARTDGRSIDESLEANCLRMKMLPSLAYGFTSCSLKWNVYPQDRFCNNWVPAKAIWKAGGKVTKAIGIDADEAHRAKKTSDNKYEYVYPLVEWDWGRDECIERIEAEGMPLPGKSSCFFCPASRKPEVLSLADEHPELMGRALAMEANAELKTVKGLGRRFNWGEFLAAEDPQGRAFPEGPDEPCMCID